MDTAFHFGLQNTLSNNVCGSGDGKASLLPPPQSKEMSCTGNTGDEFRNCKWRSENVCVYLRTLPDQDFTTIRSLLRGWSRNDRNIYQSDYSGYSGRKMSVVTIKFPPNSLKKVSIKTRQWQKENFSRRITILTIICPYEFESMFGKMTVNDRRAALIHGPPHSEKNTYYIIFLLLISSRNIRLYTICAETLSTWHVVQEGHLLVHIGQLVVQPLRSDTQMPARLKQFFAMVVTNSNAVVKLTGYEHHQGTARELGQWGSASLTWYTQDCRIQEVVQFLILRPLEVSFPLNARHGHVNTHNSEKSKWPPRENFQLRKILFK